jgi:hypothetical protein
MNCTWLLFIEAVYDIPFYAMEVSNSVAGRKFVIMLSA